MGLRDRDYLRILNHAAETMECMVEKALKTLRDRQIVPRWDEVLNLTPPARPELPQLKPLTVDLAAYDDLLHVEEVSS